MAKGIGKMLVAAGVVALAACHFLQTSFVPPAGRGAQLGAAAGVVAMLGAAPAYAAPANNIVASDLLSKGSIDKIDIAAKRLSEASYPFLKSIDWTSDVYAKLPTQSPADVIPAINAMFKMGVAMDPAALKAGVLAHSTAISHMDQKLVIPLSDYTAINAAIGHMVASAGNTKTMDVYNAFAKFDLGKDVGPYMMSKVSQKDAEAAYKAFLDFKDVIKQSREYKGFAALNSPGPFKQYWELGGYLQGQ